VTIGGGFIGGGFLLTSHPHHLPERSWLTRQWSPAVRWRFASTPEANEKEDVVLTMRTDPGVAARRRVLQRGCMIARPFHASPDVIPPKFTPDAALRVERPR
jgi:hypothetical protein